MHLCDIPLGDSDLIDRDLETRMDLLRRASFLGRSLRAKHQIKTRQVLPSMLVITRKSADRDAIERGSELLRGELNVKEVLFSTDEAAYVVMSLKPNLKSLGPRLGKELNNMRSHLELLNKDPQKVIDLLSVLEEQGKVEVLGHEMTEGDFLIDRGPKDGRLIATDRGVTVLLDTRLTPELIQEGLARELINRIQRLRKDSGLQVSDRISLTIEAEESLAVAAQAHADYIGRETLATSIKIRSVTATFLDSASALEIDGTKCQLTLVAVKS